MPWRLLRERHPRLKLVFPGTRHPNPAMAGMPNQVDAAKALAAELGVMDTAVFFGDWVPYADWPHVLQESDVALTLHFDTVETRLAFRSRVLEYIWAGLPIVATAGDATSDLVAGHGLGVVTAGGRRGGGGGGDRPAAVRAAGGARSGVCRGARGAELGAGRRAAGALLPCAAAGARPVRRVAGQWAGQPALLRPDAAAAFRA